MKIVFRTDASLQIGTGHVMRCLTLANALRERGAECRFVCREHPGNLIELIHENGFEAFALPLQGGNTKAADPDNVAKPAHADWVGGDWKGDAEATVAVLEGDNPDWVIVDHYGLDERWEATLRPCCKGTMVIDDLADRAHECDLLLDQNLYPNMDQRYDGLVPKHCLLMLGPRFMILDPRFNPPATISAPSELVVPERILIMFGGADKSGHTLAAIDAIQATAPSAVRVNVVVRGFNRDRESIVEACERDGRFSLHVDSDAVPEIMAKTQLAIGSGGISTYERLAMRIPSFLTVSADNQSEPLNALAECGFVTLFDGRSHLLALLTRAFEDGVLRPPAIVENGLAGITEALCNRLVVLRVPSPYDVRRTFQWMQNSVLRKDFMVRGAPTRKRHFEYWRRILASGEEHVRSVYFGAGHIGNAGVKNIDRERSCAELWLYIGDGGMRKRSLGQATLTQLEYLINNDLKCTRAVLHVGRDNEAAISLYRRMGYRLSENQDVEAAGFSKGADVQRMEKSI